MSLRKANAKHAAALLYSFSQILSDEDAKNIMQHGGDIKDIAAAIIEHGPPFSEHEIKCLVKAAGKSEEFEGLDGDVDAETLSKYAKYIQNYEYTYTDDAHKVDPNIDTSQKHIGPMAQDLQKVNPATVSKDKSGYLVVDTGRLALQNAGAIAALAREVEALKNG